MADTTTQAGLSELALQYLAGGVSILPCSAETKQPDFALLPTDENGKATWKALPE
jgi:hypothetical protein